MANHPFFGDVSDDFNEAEAFAAYEFFKAEPEYAWCLLHMHAHNVVADADQMVVKSLINGLFDERKELIKEAVLNGIVNKSMSDSSINEIIELVDIIKDDYTAWERGLNTDKQRRDTRGRFIPMGKTKIEYPTLIGSNGEDAPDMSAKWIQVRDSYDSVARSRNLGASPKISQQGASRNASRKKDAYYSAAWLQIAEDMKRMGLEDGEGIADVRYSNGDRRTVTSSLELLGPADFRNGRFPTSIKWYVDSDPNDSSFGTGYDVLTGIGVSGGAVMAGDQMQRNFPGATGNYQNAMLADNPEYGSKDYRKLSATANLVNELGGDALSPKAKWALSAAKYVGENGAEAEKILGPTARKTAYRYRGVERKPDAKMDRAILSSVAGAKNIDDARERLIHPSYSNKDGGKYSQDFEFSPFIKYWQKQLPKREHLKLHLASGAIAPSQGVVFNSRGQVVTQAVGYGDDHYLPFNLRKLSMANRGEWVRTRTMGGPTTEDIYAGLITGTRSITVISHSGVYNVEFDESFRGGRRFNDKTARMTRRYSQLLDTLEAENTTLQNIPPDRLEELRSKADAEFPGDGPASVQARQKRLKELQKAETSEPRPSKARIDEWAAEFGNQVADRVNDNHGENRFASDELGWEQLRAQQSIKSGENLSDVDAFAAMGLKDEYARFLDGKTREYRAQQSPLKLNGQGYYFALLALQEQFPYYIKRVEWYPPNNFEGSAGGKDDGYVKANFLRPAAAKEGYWDKEIEGHIGEEKIKNADGTERDTGKTSAHHTGYQNWENRQRVRPRSEVVREARAEHPANQDAGNSSRSEGSNADNSRSEAAPAPRVPGAPLAVVPNANRNRRVSTIGTDDAIVKWGDMAARQIISLKAPDGTVTEQAFGTANLDTFPIFSRWDVHRGQIYDPAIRVKALQELDLIFEARGSGSSPEIAGVRSGLTSAQQGQVSSVQSNIRGGGLGKQYFEQVAPTLAREPGTVSESLDTDGFFLFTPNHELFLPGRTDEEYDITARTDADIQNFRDRRSKQRSHLGTRRAWEVSLLAASEQWRDMSRGTRKDPIVYAGITYQASQVAELEAQLRSDTVGYLKTRQLERLTGADYSGDAKQQDEQLLAEQAARNEAVEDKAKKNPVYEKHVLRWEREHGEWVAAGRPGNEPRRPDPKIYR